METAQASLIEQFKKGMDPQSAGAIAERLTLAEQKVAMADTLSGQLQEANAQAAELREQRDAATTSLNEANARADVAERERDALAKSLDKAQAKVSKLPAETKPRSLGPIAEGKVLDREALKEAIADADEVEIAFSDGKKEVKGLAPVAVSGEVWRDHPAGLLLTERVNLDGPASGADYIVEGYALLLDGKQVAYTPLDTPLRIRTGQKVQLHDDIHF